MANGCAKNHVLWGWNFCLKSFFGVGIVAEVWMCLWVDVFMGGTYLFIIGTRMVFLEKDEIIFFQKYHCLNIF